MTGRPWVRPTARVVVLDPAGRVLLLGARLTDDWTGCRLEGEALMALGSRA